MMMRKQVWEKLGGFDEKLSHNEDFALAQKIKKNFQIKFVRKALVTWIPRGNLFSFFRMIYRFALGDAEARIFRPKVATIFLRYLFFISLLFINLKLEIIVFLFYLLWSIYKNYKYLKKFKAYYYLPVLQVLSDAAVMTGSVIGLYKRFFHL